MLRLSAPIAVSMVSYSAMSLVDTLFVSRLGASALAGVGLGGVLAFGISCFSIGLLRSAKILVSQAVGRGSRGDARPILGAALLLALVLGLASAALGLGLAPLAAQIAGGGEAGDAALSYLLIRLLGTPAVLVYTALRETRYGLGDSRSAMVASIVANVANAGLSWLFIFGLDLGVAGAAWSTNLACVLEAGIIAIAQRRDGVSMRAVRQYLRPLLSLGVPSGLQFMLEVGSMTLLAAMIARMGELQMAAHQLASQVLNLSFLPAMAIAEGASILTGQAVGAGRKRLVLPVAVRALTIACAWALLCAALFLLGGRAIVGTFEATPELARVALQLLAVGAVIELVDAANIVARGVLRGTGDVRVPAVAGIITAWLFTPPLTWWLGIHMGMGAMGGWIGLCFEILAGAAWFWLRLVRRHRVRAEHGELGVPVPVPVAA